MKVSIIIPAYNEAKTLPQILKAVRVASFGFSAEREIIVVDDGSADHTQEILAREPGVIVVALPINQGKGAALKEGFTRASGDIVMIQDADLEYDPADYPRLLEPIIKGRADVVYGSRFRGTYQRSIYFWNALGNKFVTMLSNLFTGLNLTDMETGYKAFRREVIDSFKNRLRSKRFGIEPELTARVARARLESGCARVFEVPINYYGRTYEEGKKIGWWDGVKAIFAVLYFNLIDR